MILISESVLFRYGHEKMKKFAAQLAPAAVEYRMLLHLPSCCCGAVHNFSTSKKKAK